MKDEDVTTEPGDEQESESLKVKTNVKAGGDPEVPGFAVDPELPSGGQ